MLFPVFQFHPDTVFLMQMFGHMLCRIDRAVLSACASEADHQMRKATFHSCATLRASRAQRSRSSSTSKIRFMVSLLWGNFFHHIIA